MSASPLLRWLRARLRRPAGLAQAAAPTLGLGRLFWHEVSSPHPWEDLLRRGELTTGNFLCQHGCPAARRSDLVFLGVDDATMKLDTRWPEEIAASRALTLISQSKGDWTWSREVHALVLDRLVSRDIVRELLADRDRYAQIVRGPRRCVTVLFSDVRGFTTLSEQAADPAAFIAQLNEYLGEVVEIVFRHRGTLDKFIGNAVMAVWGSMHTDGAEADACQAVAAALEMRQRLAALNARWSAEGKINLAIGIGVNHGEVIVGGLGSEKNKMEITVMGDAVSTASRLEGLTKDYGLDLLIGESVVARIGGAFRLRTVDRVQVKGKTRPTEVTTVIGPKAEAFHVAVDTLGHLLALLVTPANEQERAPVAALTEQVQAATEQNVELAYVDQGYTGKEAAAQAAAYVIQLEVVKLADAKRGFVLLPRRWMAE